MQCYRVLRLLSEYFDDRLEASASVQVTQHLDQCAGCRKEYEALSSLHRSLRSLGGVPAPEFLEGLVRLRIAQEENRDPWSSRVRNTLERWWSVIRTTEGMWYWTRALGTVLASVFFVLISSAVTPFYFAVNEPELARISFPAAYPQQVGVNVLQKLGMLPQETVTGNKARIQPAINDLYFVNFGQSVARAGEDDTLSVVTVVDRSGAAKIQNVLQYPADRDLLSNFSEMISSARCRPGSKNGRAVDAPLVLTFSRISVYD